MSIRTRALVLLLAAVVATGCQTKKGGAGTAADGAGTAVPTQPEAEEAVASGDGSASSGSALESAGSVGAAGAAGGPTEGLLGRRLVYFDFDSASVRGEDQPIVSAHAQYLAANPGARVRLEGHTDERGTREYNIGLAERRAQAVRRALGLGGARDGQSSAVSYGEERPAAPGEDETAYAQNRRVEIVYGN
jgi:peptidoglycan-associated lipoprotein